MIDNCVLVSNGKGGVGKTAITSSLSSLAAASGWRVLMVDIDPQGNLEREFGYTDISDRGLSLLRSVRDAQPLEVVASVRENLDVVAGGEFTSQLAEWVVVQNLTGGVDPSPRIEASLERIAGHYDLIVIDCPPGEAKLVDAFAAVAHYVVAPTTGDAASLDGLARVMSAIIDARAAGNPHIELLGIVVTFIPAGASSLEREIRAELAETFPPNTKIFSPTIRYAKKAAIDVRKRGIQPDEYEVLKDAAEREVPWYRTFKKTNVPRYSTAATGLADDYQRLVTAILDAYSTRQRELGHIG